MSRIGRVIMNVKINVVMNVIVMVIKYDRKGNYQGY